MFGLHRSPSPRPTAGASSLLAGFRPGSLALAGLVSLVVLSWGALGPTAVHGQLPPSPGEWTAYGRDAGGTRYSPSRDLHTGNVGQLEVAWVYRTGDLLPDRGRFQSTPLMVGGRLYVTSPLGRVSAVDPGERPRALDLRPRSGPLRAATGTSRTGARPSGRAAAECPTDSACAVTRLRGDHRRSADRPRRREGTRCPGFGQGRCGGSHGGPPQPAHAPGRGTR
jgi:hypothetical protein